MALLGQKKIYRECSTWKHYFIITNSKYAKKNTHEPFRVTIEIIQNNRILKRQKTKNLMDFKYSNLELSLNRYKKTII